ncbi:hypothetical protein BJX63DRAFT_149009 [Aspergillus granulosus]|uniref:Uncharacterized protein n=1 Tax=Aspergillus granulosus TaxID=176169 RepID=A0ABR4HKZ4_9EURO
MEHVSTLCAISTVGIAATGFALGRAEQAQFLDRTDEQHAPLPATDTTPLSFRNNDSRPPKTFVTAEAESPINASFSEARENATLYAEQLGDGITRRRPSFVGLRLRRRGQTLTLPPIRTDNSNNNTPTSSHSRRPSSSWIRRLSFQPEKRFSLQTPDSPSFPEPASPTASSVPSSQRRAPNKLVKRPKSQHANANPYFAHTVSSPLFPSALRRPATSYQRSDASNHKATHSLSFEPSLALNTLVEPTPRNQTPPETDDWRPYISPSSDALSERMTRRFSTATKPKDASLRRILPRTDAAPTLLLATSIAKRESTTEVALDEPSTDPPVEFRDPFKTEKVSPQPSETPSSEEDKTYQPPPEEPCPKSPAESAAPLDIRVFRNGSFAGPKQRAASTPLPNIPNMEGAIWVSPRAPGRRNITDPNVFRRPPTTQDAGFPDVFSSGIMGRKSKVISYHREYPADLGSFRYRDVSHHTSANGSALSSLQGSLRRRPKRHSLAASDPASTVIGSDDTRVFTSGDEDDTDFLSDTAFDSIRTHMTTDSSCFQSPRIETIFDRPFPPETIELPARPDGINPPSSFVPQVNNLESEREVFAAPALTLVTQNLAEAHEGDSEVSFPSDLSDNEDSQSMVASLPGDKTIRPSLTLAKFGTLSLENNGNNHIGVDNPENTDPALALKRSNAPGLTAFMEETQDSSPRMNIFDWSEQSRADREGTGPDGRPRTVHGKHGPGMRGSRTTGRKAPNTLHYRSQSVPVAREPTVPSESRQTSGKFGTWGLGSKGVSEDWDSDFDFEDKDENTVNETVKPNKEMNRQSVVVPQAIMERQASLHGQFGQVQELTLLVEELKRLRHQASFLNIVRGPSNELWKEAEGIVDLATIDDDDTNNHSPPRSPTSLTFSFDDSEVESSNMNDPWKRASGDSWRASLSDNPNVRPATSCGPDLAVLSTKTNSVLDLIYQQRLSHDPTVVNSHLPRSKKLPFDTQSLRDLVVRAGVVTRALKEVVRKAEGVTNGSEETTRPSHPPFSRIFEHPSHDDLSKFETPCIS